MPVEMGSFDIIIGMDWLMKYHVVIDYAKKIVCIPFGNEKYLLKGCHVFLAHVTTKKTEDKSKEKQLEDVPIVIDFSGVFLEDLSESSTYRTCGRFHIDLYWCIDLLQGYYIDLAPSESVKNLSASLQELSD
ncbi:putative reverse transcriptase domain-containing protein [Tanacetum coccineum]